MIQSPSMFFRELAVSCILSCRWWRRGELIGYIVVSLLSFLAAFMLFGHGLFAAYHCF